MTAPRSVPPTRECHWCGGARGPWVQRMRLRAADVSRRISLWFYIDCDCCRVCRGTGVRR